MRILIVLVSFLLFSCDKKQNDKLIDIIIDDFKQINNSKKISVVIEKDTLKNLIYFNMGNTDVYYDKLYYKASYRGFNIHILNNSQDSITSLFNKLNLNIIQPKKIPFNAIETDGYIETESYFYELNDSMVVKRMKFNEHGNKVSEKDINLKYR